MIDCCKIVLKKITIFSEIVPLHKEHENGVKLFVSVHDPDEVPRVSLSIHLVI